MAISGTVSHPVVSCLQMGTSGNADYIHICFEWRTDSPDVVLP